MNRTLEEKIIARFDEVGDNAVAERVSDNNFELVNILEFFGKPAAGRNRLLDAGCGKGKFLQKFAQNDFAVTGIEPSELLLNVAVKNNPGFVLKKASVTEIPFPDNSFDFVVCIEVLEHIPDINMALREMARVLKPGGKMIIIDKNIFSLHPAYFIPTALWKFVMERTNKWMYPKDFPFREKYFNPWNLNRFIRKRFTKSRINFILYNSESIHHSFFRKTASFIRGIVANIMHACCPFLDFYVAWQAIK